MYLLDLHMTVFHDEMERILLYFLCWSLVWHIRFLENAYTPEFMV